MAATFLRGRKFRPAFMRHTILCLGFDVGKPRYGAVYFVLAIRGVVQILDAKSRIPVRLCTRRSLGHLRGLSVAGCWRVTVERKHAGRQAFSSADTTVGQCLE